VTEFEITNVVGMVTYQQELDLLALAKTFECRKEISSVTYEPAENHWLQTRLAPDNTYVAFYRSGKCSIVGARSSKHFEELVEQVNILMRELLEFDYKPTSEIKNIVATTELDSLPPLETIALILGVERIEYEPEQFPALIYRNEACVILVFSSGKIVCTGLTSPNKISLIIDDFISLVGEIEARSSGSEQTGGDT
jgi:transcription initiation factor TFIID TATA-box-binding protein